MNTIVSDMLTGSEIFNTRFLHYSWIIPTGLFITAVFLMVYAFRRPGKKSSSILKGFLSLVYVFSGLSVWLGMHEVDAISAISGAILLWFYALLFLMDAIWWQKIEFRIPERTDLKVAMILLILLGLLYPVIEMSFGYSWPKMVLFGSECPTTTFVLGLLTGSLPKTNKWIIGFLATNAVLVGGYVGFNGFIVDAVTYLPAGIISWIMMIRYWKKAPVKKIPVMIVALVLTASLTGCTKINEEHKEAANLYISNINFQSLKTGTFRGYYEGGMYGWRENECLVTVDSTSTGSVQVVAVELIRSVEDRPHSFFAELYHRVIDRQSLQVDVITGATLTSRAHLKALENALIKAKQ